MGQVISMLKLFGQARSRASRSLWMLEEIGIAYEHMPIRPYTESRSPEYLRINPNGHIPGLDDDGFILWESLAINMYLAETYAGAPLWPGSPKGHARIYQWSLWAANELEPRIVSIAKGLSKKSSDPSAIAGSIAGDLERLQGALGVLEEELRGPYLLGDDFTVGDLNLASTLREPGEDGISGIAAIDLAPFSKVARWLDACSARPANRRVASMANEAHAAPIASQS
jgi:glutathione S-transferase